MNDNWFSATKKLYILGKSRGDIKVWENDDSDKSSYLAVGCSYSQNSSTTGDEGTVVLCQVSIHPLKNGQSPCQQLRFLSEAWQLRVFVTITWINQPCKGAEFFQLTESLSRIPSFTSIFWKHVLCLYGRKDRNTDIHILKI